MSSPPRSSSPTPVFAPRPLRSQTRAQPPILQDPPRTPPLERKPTPTISGTPGDGAPPRIYSPGPTSSEALDDFFKLVRRNSQRSPTASSMQPPQSPVRRELARNPIVFNTAFGGVEGVALGSIAGMTGMGGITVVTPVEGGTTKKEGSGES